MIRVLILDDDPLFVKALTNSLKREKTTQFVVQGVTNAEDARMSLTEASQPFDVLLIDNRLGPGADGITVMQELRQLSPESEAIIFTGLTEPEDGLRAYRNGAFRYLAKPFEEQELVWILQHLMEWRKTVYERGWFRVLAEISEQLEQSHSYDDVARLIVDGGQKLGFERARLWAFSENGATMTGIAEAGNPGLENFSRTVAPVAASPYAQRSLQQREPLFFIGRELGPTFFESQLQDGRHQSPIGEWAAIPLWSGDRCVGKLALDNAENPQTLRPSQRRLLELFGRIVSASLERTKLYEQELEQRKVEEAHHRRLAILHQASKEIVALAAEDEAWLWHATLTVATAEYGLRFDRAVLFLVDPGGTKLMGKIGIGHFDHDLAIADWEQDGAEELDFDGYLARLRAKELTPTPVEEFVDRWAIDLVSIPDSVFHAVLRSSGREIVRWERVKTELPAVFVEQFGVTDYAILPLRTTTDVLGLVVVDNVFDHESMDESSLDYLETFLAQAALLCENRRQTDAQDSLIDLNNQVVPQAWQRPLKQTLTQICEIACKVMNADLAIIYPLKPGGEPYEYESSEIGHSGLQDAATLEAKSARPPKRRIRQKGISMHVLRAGQLVIPDVQQDSVRFDGRRVAKHPFVLREVVNAVVGTSIHDLKNGDALGVLYVDHRTPRSFSPRQLSVAQSVANLAAVAITNTRQGEKGDIAQSEVRYRENELRTLQKVLTEALNEQATEQWVLETVLEQCRKLLNKPNMRVRVVLREWLPGAAPGDDPIETLVYYAMRDGVLISDAAKEGDNRELHRRVLQTREAEIFNDIHSTECHGNGNGNGDEKTCSELDAPILLGGREIGLLNIESPHYAAFTPADKSALERLAAVTALAIDNTHRQGNLFNILEAAKAVTAPLGLDETLKQISASIRKVVPDLSTLTIWYLDSESGRVKLGPYFGIRHTDMLMTEEPTEGNVVTRVMQSAEPIYAMNVREEGAQLYGPFVETEDIHSTAAFSLRTDDQVVGAMFFSYRREHWFNTEEKALFPIMAEIVAASIRDALALGVSQRTEKRLRTALDITRAVGTTVDLEQTIARIMHQLVEEFPRCAPCIVRYDHESEGLVFQRESFEFYVIDNPDFLDMTNIALYGRSAATRVARKALQSRQLEAEVIPDVEIDPDYRPLRMATQSQCNVSLMSTDGNLLGVLVLESTQRDDFDEDDVQLLRAIARQVSIAFERARQAEDLEFKSTLSTATAWAADMAHDINREVGFIRNRTYWLSEEEDISEEGKSYVVEIEASAERLADARPLTGTSAPIELGRQMRRWIDEMVETHGQSVTVAYELGCGNQIIYANPTDLLRCLRHLVRNAIRAIQSAGVLTVRTRPVGDRHIEIEIADSGPGVPEYLRKKFFRQKLNPDSEEGGLGLLIARAAVERMKGTIRCLPYVAGEGARFVITLPIGEEETVDDQQTEDDAD